MSFSALIFDRDPNLCKALEQQLRSLDPRCSLEFTADAHEARVKLYAKHFDLVLLQTDAVFDDTADIARRIRAHQLEDLTLRRPSLIIGLSDSPGVRELARCLPAGMNTVIKRELVSKQLHFMLFAFNVVHWDPAAVPSVATTEVAQRVFKALSGELPLGMLGCLGLTGPLSVGELLKSGPGLKRQNLEYHLKALEKAELVERRRVEGLVRYALRCDVLPSIAEWIKAFIRDPVPLAKARERKRRPPRRQ